MSSPLNNKKSLVGGAGGILRIHMESPESNHNSSKRNSARQVQEANNLLGNGTQGIQHHIQQSWSSFGMMTEVQRATLLKGLIERCSNREIDYICSLLNFKLAENSQVRAIALNDF
jgi:hypothetical protein